MTKQLQIASRVFTAKQLRVSTISMVSLKTKFEGDPLDRRLGAQPMLERLTTLPNCYCRLHTYI